jgi:glycerophosphoryl diester phosphodiesterase
MKNVILMPFEAIAFCFLIIIIIIVFIFSIILIEGLRKRFLRVIKSLLYTPRKSSEIYNVIWAHRGVHANEPENTMNAYLNAVKSNMGIEMDIRLTKDKKWVCFNDRYTGRLLNIPGKLNNKTYNEIKRYKVLKSSQPVPLFTKALKEINGSIPILIEVKDFLTKEGLSSIEKILSSYEGEVYFHTKNIITYYALKKAWKDRVFFVLNPFRKRFEFIKGADYRGLNIPTGMDLIISVEEGDTAKTVVNKLWYAYNKYNTRILENDILLSKPIAHRCIVDKNLPEHSLEAIRECIKRGAIIEFDVAWYNGEVICYHSDKASNKLGQKSSCAEKICPKDSITLEQILKEVDGKTELIMDIKDVSPKNRRLQIAMMDIIKKLGYKGTFYIQAYNPFVLMWFCKNYPLVKRGIVGNSLSKFEGTLPETVRFVIGFVFFVNK